MGFARGILKYGFYLFIGAWMFALGVMVGRGTSPVSFDTASFQERLRVIVGKVPKDAPEEEKVDLDFYEALNQPAVNESIKPAPLSKPPPPAPPARPAETAVADIPSKAEPNTETAVPLPRESGEVPVKQSRKLASLKQKALAQEEKKNGRPLAAKAPASLVAKAEVKTPGDNPGSGAADIPEKTGADNDDGAYTIQVAAYRAFKDAVSQMSILAQKGFPSYRTRGTKDGDTWYRVRTGSFKDVQSAQAELDRLRQAKINGMIIKKDDQ